MKYFIDEWLVDFVLGHGKLWALFVWGAISFVLAFTLFYSLMFWVPNVYYGALGCGVGTAIVNAIVMAIHAPSKAKSEIRRRA